MSATEETPIGVRLRTARENMGLSVIQASEKLHMDPMVIEALEAERFEALGASVYVRGHMRRYAELVGESPQVLQEQYISRLTKALEPDLRTVPTTLPPVARSVKWPVIVIVAIVLVAGLGWWLLDWRRSAPVVAATGAETSEAKPESAAASETIVVNDAPRTAASGRLAQLRLKFREDSWAEIFDADGQRLFYDVGASGTEHIVSGNAPLRVKFANPAGVQLQVNGKAVTPPSSAEFQLAADGRIVPHGSP